MVNSVDVFAIGRILTTTLLGCVISMAIVILVALLSLCEYDIGM